MEPKDLMGFGWMAPSHSSPGAADDLHAKAGIFDLGTSIPCAMAISRRRGSKREAAPIALTHSVGVILRKVRLAVALLITLCR